MAAEEVQGDANGSGFRQISHDIRNQLSNITLSLEQLKYELPVDNADALFYIETIAGSCKQINELLKRHAPPDEA